jgi:branched-chain amino acid transport system permease protein
MNTLFAGLTVGAIYALVAVGYNLIFVATGVFNFAQAQFVMLGTFIAYFFMVTVGVPWPVAIVGGVAIGFLGGMVEERIAIRPLQGRGMHGELVTTLGVAVLLDGLAVRLWGSDPLFVTFGSSRPLDVLGGRLFVSDLTLIVLGVVLALGAELVLTRTIWGRMNLATAEDRDAARLRGINVGRLSLLAFGLAGALCMGMGVFVAAKTTALASLGDAFAIKGFVALAIGGFGSQKGALVGGMTAGLVEAVSARYLNASWQDISVFILLLVVLMVRPTGLFGEKEQRVV